MFSSIRVSISLMLGLQGCLQLLSFVLLYFPDINTTLILNQSRVYEWKVQQGEGQQENTIQYIYCTFSIANRTYVYIAHSLQSRSLHYVREYCNECAMYTYVRFAIDNVQFFSLACVLLLLSFVLLCFPLINTTLI
jgi:hypothetical protein